MSQANQFVSSMMNDINNSIVLHGNEDNDSDVTVDSEEDETVANCNSVQPIVLPTATKDSIDALASSNFQMQSCENITIGSKNYFHGPVTIISDTKFLEQSELRNRSIEEAGTSVSSHTAKIQIYITRRMDGETTEKSTHKTAIASD